MIKWLSQPCQLSWEGGCVTGLVEPRSEKCPGYEAGWWAIVWSDEREDQARQMARDGAPGSSSDQVMLEQPRFEVWSLWFVTCFFMTPKATSQSHKANPVARLYEACSAKPHGSGHETCDRVSDHELHFLSGGMGSKPRIGTTNWTVVHLARRLFISLWFFMYLYITCT